MGRVLTNNMGLARARQTSLGVLGGSPTWKLTEPNSFGEAGATIVNTPRDPISKNRQRRKGTTTDLDSSIEYEADLTLDAMLDAVEEYLFSTAANGDLTFRGGDPTGTGFTVAALTATQASRLQWVSGGMASLLYSAGYLLAANNGLHVLTADPVTTDTELVVSGLSAETSPANAEVSVAGIRAEAGDLAMTITSGVGTITSGNNSATNNIDFTTLGLTLGQYIHVGGTTSANQPASAAATPTYGYGRVIAIAAGSLMIDKLEQANAITSHPALLAFDGTDDNAAGTNVPIDLLFGRFVRNVSVDHADYAELYTQFELESPNLFETTPPTPVASPDGFEYMLDNIANTLALNLPLTDKATMSLSYIGTDTENPVDNASRKANATTPLLPLFNEAFNTSADYARLRITDIDEAGLTTDFKTISLTINDNASAEKVQGQLGAKFLNTGNFLIDLETNVLFTNPLIPARIRDNVTVTMDFILENGDGAIAFDIPSGTLSSGGREYPVNESVQASLTLQAFEDPTLGTSLGVSFFPIVPASAA